MNSTATIGLRVNGVAVTLEVDVRWTLADLLRTGLRLTGTHLGCEHGVCGSCTVLLDGHTVRSCLTLAVQTDGREVRTVEGLASADGTLHPIQEAFARHHALQCGFCTPGFLMTVAEMLDENVPANQDSIRERLSGNLCRCTGYHNIVVAVMELLEQTG